MGTFGGVFHPPSPSFGICLRFSRCLWDHGGSFCPLMGPCEGGCRQHGAGTAFGPPPHPTARLTGLFAEGQRNHRTAEIPAHPKGAQRGPGVMQGPEREPRGAADPHQPIFYPESPFFSGQSPVGFGMLILAPLEEGDASRWHLLLRRHRDEDTIGTWRNGNLAPHDPTWRGKYPRDGSWKQQEDEQGNGARKPQNTLSCGAATTGTAGAGTHFPNSG